MTKKYGLLSAGANVIVRFMLAMASPHRRRLVRQEAVAGLMHGWLLVLTFVNLLLANAVVSFVIAHGSP